MRPLARFKLFRNRIRKKIFHSQEEILYTKDVLGEQYEIGDHTYGKPKVISWGERNIRNRYQVRITNKAAQDQTYVISARGIPSDALDLGNFREITVKPGHSGLVQASVRLSPAVAAQTPHFELVITPVGKPAEARGEKVRFDTPGKHP